MKSTRENVREYLNKITEHTRQPCNDCHVNPKIKGRSYCQPCRRIREQRYRERAKTEPIYKIGTHGFVYIWTNNHWVKSSLPPHELRRLEGNKRLVRANYMRTLSEDRR